LIAGIREVECQRRIDAWFLGPVISGWSRAMRDSNYMKAKNSVVAVALFALTILCRQAHAQGTAFTYQGHLVESGVEANGSFDFRFGLYTNISTTNFTGSLETNAATAVSNGVFTTTLNFSNVFNGTAYWLEIGVRTNGTTNAFTILSPRQPITPAPYAITASNLTGTLPASQLTGSIPASIVSGTFSNSVSFTNGSNVFSGNGAGLTGVEGVTSSNFVYAYDNTSQLVASAGAFQNVSFASSSTSGWFIPASGEFVAPQTGLYLVEYQAHFFNANSTSAASAIVRCVLNLTSTPVEIPSSEAVVTVPAQYVLPASRSFLVSMLSGQMLSLQMTTGIAGSSGAYLFSSSFAGQNFPSISLTVVRLQ
jgi:hypothetical protein